MTKPKQPPTPDELIDLWMDYFVRLEAFRERNKKDSQLYQQRHTEKERLRREKWKQLNAEKHRESMKKYYASPKGRQKRIERLQRYIAEHPECNLERLEKWLRIAEGNRPLEACPQYDYRRTGD
jgi:hypothetical protein